MKKCISLLFLLCCCLVTTVWSQNKQVKGKVTDEKGAPIEGVSVVQKGSGSGAQTTSDGTFSITVNADKTELTFSFTGYTGKTISANAGSNVTVQLAAATTSSLDEVVVVGYQAVRRRDVTGAVSSVSSKDIKDIPLSSAAEALTGRLPGVQLTTTEGAPGAEVVVRVRGGGSITGDNSPIYIVDGIQVENALSFLSPREIESVDVLKDAASTAIYGARGANGVIIITTKSGRNMKTIVGVDLYRGQRHISQELDVMHPYDFVQYQYQIYNGSQADRDAFRDKYGRWEDLDIYRTVPFANWQDKLFGRDAISNSQSVNVTGGDQKTTFNLNFSNLDESGIMLNSGFKRMNGSFKFDHRVSDRFRVGLTGRYGDQSIQGSGTTNSGTQGNNRLRNAIRYKPFIGGSDNVDVFDPDYANLTNLTNPVLLTNNETRYAYRKDISVNAYASLNIFKNLTLKSVIGINNTYNKTNQFSGTATSVARQNANQPVVVLGRGENLGLTSSNTLSYSTTVRKDHRIDVLAGQEVYQYQTTNLSTTVKWLPVDISATEAFAGIQKATPPTGQIQDPPTTSQGQTRLLSFFGRANYSYRSKYTATLTLRRDGSSLFGPNYKYGTFPAAAVAWTASQEGFLGDFFDAAKISFFKVRLSYGAVGNNRIGQDLFKTTYGVSTSSYAFTEAITPGFAPLALANPNIKWETTISRNLGFDLAFLRNRLNLTVDLYLNNVKDLLLQQQIPTTSGWSNQQQNIGKTENKGIEVQVSGVVMSTKNFSWNANFNVSANRNKVVDLGLDPSGKPVTSILASSGWITGSTYDYRVDVGKPLGQMYGYITNGFYTVDDFDYNATTAAYTLKAGIPNSSAAALGNRAPQPGDLKLKKLSAKSSTNIDDEDKAIIGNAQPKFIGGFNQQFVYKNWDASVFVNWSVGNKIYNANKLEFTTQYLYRDNNMLSLMNDRWKSFDANGVRITDPTALKALNANTQYWTPPGGQYFLHSWAIEDGSFLRINNLTIGYSLPKTLLRKTKVVSSFRAYATVNNLATITGYSGFDPEASTRRSNPLTPGVDYASYPRSQYYVLGLQVTF